MTTMQEPLDVNGEVLFTIATTVAKLRADLTAMTAAQASTEEWRARIEKDRVNAYERATTQATAREAAEAHSRRLYQETLDLKGEIEHRRVTGQELLAKYDRITLRLYEYIDELKGFRDTGKTKAERIALGHVVERLKDIYKQGGTQHAENA